MHLTIDPEFKSLIPPLLPEERKQLEENLIAEGCRDPIVTWGAIILDGHNRYEICEQHNFPFKTKPLSFDDRDQAKMWIIKNQFGRRNLNAYQRSELALKLEDIIAAQAKERQRAAGGDKKSEAAKSLVQKSSQVIENTKTREEIAKLAGVSHDTIGKVKTIQTEAPEPVKRAVHDNVISIHKGAQITKALRDVPENQKEEKAKEFLTPEAQKKIADHDKKVDAEARIVDKWLKAFSGLINLEVTEENFNLWLDYCKVEAQFIDVEIFEIESGIKKLTEIRDLLVKAKKPRAI